MIINKLVFPIKANLDYVEGSIPRMKLTANTLNRDILYVISPAVGDTIIKGNFQNSLGGNEIVSSNFELTDIKVSELVGKGESYYELIKDWNVWSSVIPNKAISYISSNRAGGIGVSFSFSEYSIPKIPKEIEFKGEVFETSQISGDGVWVVKTTLLEYGGFDFGYNDLLIRLNGDIIQKKSILRRGNTGTINYSVDPSVYDTKFEEVEFNLVEELLGVVNETKSDYLILNNKVELLVDGKQDKLVAGNNITIDPNTNVISSSGGNGGGGNSYEPDGVTIVFNENDELSVSKNLEIDGGTFI